MSWQYFKGVPRKSAHPLTPEQEKIRYQLWMRWSAKGKRMTLGRWNMAAACARAVTSYNRGSEWARKMKAYKGAKAAWRKYHDPVTGKIPFACGKFDAKVASRMGVEKWKAIREEKERRRLNQPLKHHIPS